MKNLSSNVLIARVKKNRKVFTGENDKIFLEKNCQYIRIINEKEKKLINVYFCEKPIIDFFQNAEYEKELQYYGINEKDFIKTDI
ncbi:spore coat protein CotS [Campylobacter coli]|nr:spore coat protein CotS [Campylobacter coli]